MAEYDGRDFATTDIRFNPENANPKSDVQLGFSKQAVCGEDIFWFTVWGDWGNIKDFQFDLSFKNKKECINFLKQCIEVVKAEVTEREASDEH